MAKSLESSWIKGIRILLAFCIFCILLSAVSGAIFATIFYYMPYSEKVKIILTNTNNEHLIDVFSETPSRVKKLNIIIGVVVGFSMLLLAFSFFLFKVRGYAVDKCVWTCLWLKNLAVRQYHYYSKWPSFEKSALIGLFFVFIAFKIYLFLALPPFLDEVGTYKYFSSKGVFTAASYYPIPNNHILNSVLSAISVLLPIDILLAIRIPALLFSILYFFVSLKFLDSIFPQKHQVILFSMILFCFLPPISSYGCLCRGYIFVLTFYLIQLNAIFLFLKGHHIRSSMIVYVLAGVLGNYTIPTHMYSIIVNSTIVFAFLIFSKRWVNLARFFTANVLLGFISIILYIPIFLVSGLNSIINNPFSKPKGFKYVADNLFTFWNNWLEWALGINNIDYLLVAVLGLILLQIIFMKGYGKGFGSFLILNLLLHSTIFLVHGAIPFNRNLIYICIPLGLCMSFFLFPLLQKSRISFALVGTVLLIFFILNGLKFHKREFEEDYSAKSLIATLEASNWHSKDLDTIYSQNLYYLEAMVEFDHYRHGAKNDLVIIPYRLGIDSCKNIVFKKSILNGLNKDCSFSDQQYCVSFCDKNLPQSSKNPD